MQSTPSSPPTMNDSSPSEFNNNKNGMVFNTNVVNIPTQQQTISFQQQQQQSMELSPHFKEMKNVDSMHQPSTFAITVHQTPSPPSNNFTSKNQQQASFQTQQLIPIQTQQNQQPMMIINQQQSIQQPIYQQQPQTVVFQAQQEPQSSTNNFTNAFASMNDDSQDSLDESGKKRKPGKRRFIWSSQLHSMFLRAIEKLGPEAVPKKIMQEMNIEGLTRENVASHLQKWRLAQKKISDGQSSPPPKRHKSSIPLHLQQGGDVSRTSSGELAQAYLVSLPHRDNQQVQRQLLVIQREQETARNLAQPSPNSQAQLQALLQAVNSSNPNGASIAIPSMMRDKDDPLPSKQQNDMGFIRPQPVLASHSPPLSMEEQQQQQLHQQQQHHQQHQQQSKPVNQFVARVQASEPTHNWTTHNGVTQTNGATPTFAVDHSSALNLPPLFSSPAPVTNQSPFPGSDMYSMTGSTPTNSSVNSINSFVQSMSPGIPLSAFAPSPFGSSSSPFRKHR